MLGYVSAIESYQAIVDRVRRRLTAIAGQRKPYAIIGHSLGGVIARAALGDWPRGMPLPCCLILLGAPARAPLLAQRLHRHFLYRLVNGEPGQLLAQAEFFARLPASPVPVTVIAGTTQLPAALNPFGDQPSDGVVSVEETRLPDHPLVAVAASHTFMMNNPKVRAQIRAALSAASGLV
jgi:alpha-beta hydrolase superfamily lysophospholipase